MTVFCPLNQPQCKRSIMTSRGAFVKQECPISKGRKCAFAPAVCPMIYQDKEECYWSKIQDVINQGGCNVKNLQSPLIAQLCKEKADRFSASKKTVKTVYPPLHCAELPPCTRCPFGGRRSNDARGSNDPRNKRKLKKENDNRTLVKSEDFKAAASPDQSRLNGENPEQPFLQQRKKSRKELERPLARLTKTEDIKVSAHPEVTTKSRRPESQVTSPEAREKIFREAIADKVKKLSKHRESLLVPQCSSASRRPLPCAGCLVDFLSLPPLATQPETNYVYKSGEEERCRLQRILATCPALRVPSMCPKGCVCPDVALLEEEEEDDERCPFAMAPTLSKSETTSTPVCPLSRLSKHPLVLDATRLPEKGEAFEPCKCPLIPNNCCYTLPGCPVHTMRAIIDCPDMRNH